MLIVFYFNIKFLILLSYRNILSVEEYIKESLFLETSASKSLYRSIRLDNDSMEIKRILDEQVVRSAGILKEAVSSNSFCHCYSLLYPFPKCSKRCPQVKPSWRSA